MSIPSDKIFLGYWKLHCKLEEITICRNCGMPLDKYYKKRRRGKLCIDCYIKEALDIDTVTYDYRRV
jgi:protein-arginine kinase activator protein McsA